MEKFLAHTYHHLIYVLLLIFALALMLTIRKHKKSILSQKGRHILMLAVIIALSFWVRTGFSPKAPQVINDEFYYLSVAENIAVNNTASPLIERSYPPYLEEPAGFIPPYPHGWPVLLSLYFKLTNCCTFKAASDLSLFLSVITPLFVFLAAFLLMENLGPDPEKQKKSALLAGLFSALIWAFLPAAVKASGSAGLETPSVLFIWIALGALFLYHRKPSPEALLLFCCSFALCIQMRPENIIYGAIGALFLIKKKERLLKDGFWISCAVIMLSVILLASAMTTGLSDPERARVFTIETRPGFTSYPANIGANLINNLIFFTGLYGIHPPVLTLLFVAGIILMIPLRHCPPRGWLLLGWFCFFYGLLSLFPFGDFACRYSSDSWRFALNPYIPMTLGASYGCCAIISLFQKFPAKRMAWAVLLFLIILWPFQNLMFFYRNHPHLFYFNETKRLKEAFPINTIFMAQEPEEVLIIRYGSKTPVYLLKNQKDLQRLNLGHRRILLVTLKGPSELILENFNIRPVTSESRGNTSYGAYFIEKTDSP